MIELLAFVLILALAFANGTNDVSKAIATLVGSGVSDYRTALVWGTAWTVVGAGLSAFVAGAMLKTFSQGLIASGAALPATVALSVLMGAIGWVLIATRTGLPVSTTHALTGSIVGAGLMALGSQMLLWPNIFKKIGLPLLLSPLLGLMVSLLVHPLIRALAARWEGTCLCLMPQSRALVTIDATGGTRTLFQTTLLGLPMTSVPTHCDRAGLRGLTVGLDSFHWLSSGLTSLARGTNDAPKIAAILLLGSAPAWPNHTIQTAAFVGVALAMGIGSYWGGHRVTEVLAERVTKMDHVDGLSANVTTSSLVFAAALLGLPVSTTHVSSSSIIGIGLLKGRQAVRWSTVRDMVLAWIVTLPAPALLACLAFIALNRLL